MSNYDHYFEANEIADKIEVEGFSEHATEIREVIDNGRSGTEIFMQLRFYLSPLQKNKKIDKLTQNRIQILLDYIDEALTR